MASNSKQQTTNNNFEQIGTDVTRGVLDMLTTLRQQQQTIKDQDDKIHQQEKSYKHTIQKQEITIHKQDLQIKDLQNKIK